MRAGNRFFAMRARRMPDLPAKRRRQGRGAGAGEARSAQRCRRNLTAAADRALPTSPSRPRRSPMSPIGLHSISMNWQVNFTRCWTRGKDLPHLRFIIQNDRETTAARLALVEGIVTILASGLALLGVRSAGRNAVNSFARLRQRMQATILNERRVAHNRETEWRTNTSQRPYRRQCSARRVGQAVGQRSPR